MCLRIRHVAHGRQRARTALLLDCSPQCSPGAPLAEARNLYSERHAEPSERIARRAHADAVLTRARRRRYQKTTMKTVACALLLASAAALAPTPARTAVSKAAPKPALHYQVAAAATAFAPLAALAGGQSEGTGLSLGIDDPREGTVLWVIGGFFFATYYNWAKEQPDSDSDFFAEYDERRL